MDNTKSWSGDHCVDPRLVPGVFWCNREIATEQPNILDIAPTALELFGVEIPRYMQGASLFRRRAADTGVGPAVSDAPDEQHVANEKAAS